MYSKRMGDPEKWIPKDQLEVGARYVGTCRNATDALWNGKVFLYTRHKFGHTFQEEIECPEDDRGFDVFFAQEKL